MIPFELIADSFSKTIFRWSQSDGEGGGGRTRPQTQFGVGFVTRKVQGVSLVIYKGEKLALTSAL